MNEQQIHLLPSAHKAFLIEYRQLTLKYKTIIKVWSEQVCAEEFGFVGLELTNATDQEIRRHLESIVE